MKTRFVYLNQIRQGFLYLLFPVTIFFIPPPQAKAGTRASVSKKGTRPFDTIIITKNQVSKKYKIKLFTGAMQDGVFFTVNGETGKIYQLFFFDMDGKLIRQAQIKSRETTLLGTFAKGDYMFQVFIEDEQIENGTMQVR
jgi:hypothetical protein